MKKILATFFLILTSTNLCLANFSEHKVLKVIDGDTVYLDFNDNGIYEKNERVRLNGIDTFETRLNYRLNFQKKDFNISDNEALGLGYFAKTFAYKKLLNKTVRANYTGDRKYDKNKRHLMSIYYYENNEWKNYEKEILQEGLAVVYPYSNMAYQLEKYQNNTKLKDNINNTDSLNLFILNTSNNTYHKTSCKNAWNIKYQRLINIKDKNSYYLKKYKPAKCCIN